MKLNLIGKIKGREDLDLHILNHAVTKYEFTTSQIEVIESINILDITRLISRQIMYNFRSMVSNNSGKQRTLILLLDSSTYFQRKFDEYYSSLLPWLLNMFKSDSGHLNYRLLTNQSKYYIRIGSSDVFKGATLKMMEMARYSDMHVPPFVIPKPILTRSAIFLFYKPDVIVNIGKWV